ncbi:YbhB/YbcL family Raf kinase inhibitor-like protein [Ferruginibacter sp. HRS2-29]|uniref:YbhB/YbcL family Raf kinase inhibitor-like protein n=1 Tax=Ferruginibacter sp. HRS2-29 TaxID=2487334 RepID=UPI0020CDA82F|nr:YbhB/YbcL family Raf kinase inhibitor-like protein [Ferruginibacter sp. HRS2-29]MCP9751156.1 YbhB/YbcL family Raf kinase inhibitor-like protein [Ferruginibacter sp. HRS2-29]
MSLVSNATVHISSPAFKNGAMMPSRFSCEGENINPPLLVKNLPKETKALALIMEDPDAPKGTFDHWVMWNIRPTQLIQENTSPGIQGLNSRGSNQYIGPCPPYGTHRYRFMLYALDSKLELDKNSGKEALKKAMEGHVVGQGEITGLYKKVNVE